MKLWQYNADERGQKILDPTISWLSPTWMGQYSRRRGSDLYLLLIGQYPQSMVTADQVSYVARKGQDGGFPSLWMWTWFPRESSSGFTRKLIDNEQANNTQNYSTEGPTSVLMPNKGVSTRVERFHLRLKLKLGVVWLLIVLEFVRLLFIQLLLVQKPKVPIPKSRTLPQWGGTTQWVDIFPFVVYTLNSYLQL